MAVFWSRVFSISSVIFVECLLNVEGIYGSEQGDEGLIGDIERRGCRLDGGEDFDCGTDESDAELSEGDGVGSKIVSGSLATMVGGFKETRGVVGSHLVDILASVDRYRSIGILKVDVLVDSRGRCSCSQKYG